MKIYSENCTKKAMYLKSKKMENTDLKKTLTLLSKHQI